MSHKSNLQILFPSLFQRNDLEASVLRSVTAFPRLVSHKNVIIKCTPSCTLNVDRSIDLRPLLILSSFFFSIPFSLRFPAGPQGTPAA